MADGLLLPRWLTYITKASSVQLIIIIIIILLGIMKSERLRCTGYVAWMAESMNSYRILVGRLLGKRSLGRPRRRYDDNIQTNLGYEDGRWMVLAQGFVISGAVSSGSTRESVAGIHIGIYCKHFV